jgi:hypothetical protein
VKERNARLIGPTVLVSWEASYAWFCFQRELLGSFLNRNIDLQAADQVVKQGLRNLQLLGLVEILLLEHNKSG